MKVKFEIEMEIDDDFFDDAKRWEHHADELLDLDDYPEIKSISGCKVTQCDKHYQEDKASYYKNAINNIIAEANADGLLIQAYSLEVGKLLLESGIGLYREDYSAVCKIPTYVIHS